MRPDPRPILAALAVVFTASCASEPAPTAPAAPGTLAYDRGVFVDELLFFLLRLGGDAGTP